MSHNRLNFITYESVCHFISMTTKIESSENYEENEAEIDVSNIYNRLKSLIDDDLFFNSFHKFSSLLKIIKNAKLDPKQATYILEKGSEIYDSTQMKMKLSETIHENLNKNIENDSFNEYNNAVFSIAYASMTNEITLTAKIQEIESENNEKLKEFDDFKQKQIDKIKILTDERDSIQLDKNNLETKISQLNAEIDLLKSQQNPSTNTPLQYNAVDELSVLKSEYSLLQQKYDSLKSQIGEYRTLIDKMKSNLSVVSSILEETSKSQIIKLEGLQAFNRSISHAIKTHGRIPTPEMGMQLYDLSDFEAVYLLLDKLSYNETVNEFSAAFKSGLAEILDENNCDVLMFAASKGNIHLVRSIVKCSTKIDFTKLNIDNCNALQLAAKNGHLDVVGYLISIGFDKNFYSGGRNVILHAVMKGKLSIVKYLESIGCDINSKSMSEEEGNCAYYATLYNHLDVLQFLESKGADLNSKDKYRESCIHIAAKANNVEILDFLISHGVNINETQSNNWTPLHIAAFYGSVEAAKFLIEKGANIDAKDYVERTPLDLAKSKSATERKCQRICDILSK